MIYFTNKEMKNAETFANARAKMDDSMFPCYLRVDIGKFTKEEKNINKEFANFLSEFASKVMSK